MDAGGVHLSGGVQVALTGTLVLSLFVVVAISAPAVDTARLTPFAPHGWGAIAPAALVLVWP